MGNEKAAPSPATTASEATQKAARQILALRQLTRETGTITTRTQNSILQSLLPEVLAEVAEILADVEGGVK